MDKSETDGRKSKRNEFSMSLKANWVLSHAFWAKPLLTALNEKKKTVCVPLRDLKMPEL